MGLVTISELHVLWYRGQLSHHLHGTSTFQFLRILQTSFNNCEDICWSWCVLIINLEPFASSFNFSWLCLNGLGICDGVICIDFSNLFPRLVSFDFRVTIIFALTSNSFSSTSVSDIIIVQSSSNWLIQKSRTSSPSSTAISSAGFGCSVTSSIFTFISDFGISCKDFVVKKDPILAEPCEASFQYFWRR